MQEMRIVFMKNFYIVKTITKSENFEQDFRERKSCFKSNFSLCFIVIQVTHLPHVLPNFNLQSKIDRI